MNGEPRVLGLLRARGLRKVPGTTRCPSHNDRHPSLSVSLGQDGRALLKCHADCSLETILVALGASKGDLFAPGPNGSAHHAASRPRTRSASPPPDFEPGLELARRTLSESKGETWVVELLRKTLDCTPDTLERLEGGVLPADDKRPARAVFPMHAADGRLIGIKVRSGLGVKSQDARGSRTGSMGFSTLRDRPESPVIALEGEHDLAAVAEALPDFAALAFPGVKRIPKDLPEAVRGRDVVVVGQGDEPGLDAVKHVAQRIAGAAARVRVVDWPELQARAGKAKDPADVLRLVGGATVLREAIEGAEESAQKAGGEGPRADHRPPWTPFPVEVLPFSLAGYVHEVSSAIGCDPSFIASAVLSCLAGAIGNRRRIRLKQSWTEPAVLWGMIVARSGALKSPALSLVTQPLQRLEAKEIEAEKERREAYEADMERWKALPSAGKGDKPPGPLPANRLLVSNITTEALAERLSHSPAGLLLYRDELAAWIRSFDQYRAGRGGDAQAYLEMHRAGAVTVDRKKSGTIHVPRAALSILGSIQPGTLRDVLGHEHHENGLAARILFVMPPERPKEWTDADVSDKTANEWARLLEEIRSLPFKSDGDDPHVPIDLGLTPDAEPLWVDFYNRPARRELEAESQDLAAALAKLEGYAARLALVLALAENPRACTVDKRAMKAGVVLADWFAREAERVYATFSQSPQERERDELIEAIRTRGGETTPRELMKSGPRRYRGKTADAERDLEDLVKDGLGKWRDVPSGPQGGRPGRRFVLSTSRVETEPKTPPDGEDGSANNGAEPARTPDPRNEPDEVLGSVSTDDIGNTPAPDEVVERQAQPLLAKALVAFDGELVPRAEARRVLGTGPLQGSPREDQPTLGEIGFWRGDIGSKDVPC